MLIRNKASQSSQVDSVCVQVHTNHIWWGIIEVKVSGVHADNERTGRVQNPSQREGTQWDVGTLPLERKDHLEGQIDGWKCHIIFVFSQLNT